jgi:hypothetical protein
MKRTELTACLHSQLFDPEVDRWNRTYLTIEGGISMPRDEQCIVSVSDANRTTHYARYTVKKGVITVSSVYGSRTREIDDGSPHALARSMLLRMIPSAPDMSAELEQRVCA